MNQLQAVIFNGQEHLDTEFFDGLPEALVWIKQAEKYATGFNIYCGDKVQLTGYYDDGILHINEVFKEAS